MVESNRNWFNKYNYTITKSFQKKLYNYIYTKCVKEGICCKELGGLLVSKDYCFSEIDKKVKGINIEAIFDIVVSYFVVVKNIANPLYDPTICESYFERSEEDIDIWKQELEKYNMEIIGYWHSHPNCLERYTPPVPSESDLKRSEVEWESLFLIIGQSEIYNTKEWEIYIYQNRKRKFLSRVSF